MTMATILMLVLGIAFLWWGWRGGDPDRNGLLVLAKSLSNVKRDVTGLQEHLTILEQRLENHEKMEIHIDNVITKPVDNVITKPTKKAASKTASKDTDTKNGTDVKDHTKAVTSGRKKGGSKVNSDIVAFPEIEAPRQGTEPLPEKYQKVLELAEFGLTVSEIADRLLLSQDAIMMVLRTHKRGLKA